MSLIFAALAPCFLFGDVAQDKALSNRHNVIFGSCEADEIRTTPARPFVNGRAGDDILIMSSGLAAIGHGGTGNDQIYAGVRNEIFYGGSGRDLFVFDGDFGQDIIEDYSKPDGDKILVISYDPSLQRFDDLPSFRVKATPKGNTILDFAGYLGFGNSRIIINNLSPDEMSEEFLEIRYIES